ncbi:MAG TPA: SMP-30/gluconolactonase/LRE family protein [Flavisolibacter sp.]|nr:SMP-30/gluconolactonase/LRE family protein [Flavisolibacter sp.]
MPSRAFMPVNYNNAASGDTGIVADGAVPQLISHQFSFAEGPAVDKDGNIFFTDQPNNRIWEYSTDGKFSIFMEPCGRSNGLYFDHKGNLLACADEQNQLWKISPQKKVTVLLKDLDGKKLNGPNDLWVSPTGAIYITDPYYQRDYWTRKQPEIDGQFVYLISKEGKTIKPVITNLQKPNGIVGTPDGKYLYVADIQGNKTYRYAIQHDGSLKDEMVFTELGSDGMTIDEQGNLYLTGNGVTVFNPQGKQIAHFPIPEKWTGNLAFGGKDRKLLFITASEGIYTLKMNVRGVE